MPSFNRRLEVPLGAAVALRCSGGRPPCRRITGVRTGSGGAASAGAAHLRHTPLVDRSLAERVLAPAAVAVGRPVELRVASTRVAGRADVILDESNGVTRRVSLLSGVIPGIRLRGAT
jgi:hypothetical protein